VTALSQSRRSAPSRLRQPLGRHAPSPAVAGHRPLTLALSVAAAFLAPNNLARAQASGLQAIHGSASQTTQGNKTVITTQNGAGTGHSVLNWQSFSVPSGSITQFNQPSTNSTAINRVLGNNPSAIFGTLSSNGRLVLVNPSGIAVGAGAVVDTAGFTASVLRMSEADAIAGRLIFGGDSLSNSQLSANGQILARSGDIVLIAPDLQTGPQALLEAPNGATVLAAGQKVDITGRGLEGIRLQMQAPTDQAVNLGTLKGDAVGVFAATLKHSGLIQANAVSTEGGKVVLKAKDNLEIDGSVKASNGALGGQIHATANKVKLKSGAMIDVSGAQGGGEALIGGGWQGQDSRIENAKETTAEAGSTIKADATDSGNGGTVVLWSDDVTRTAAAISARGGTQAGDGGKVETSGKKLLDVTVAAEVQARSGTGLGGQWLLDPLEIVIAATGGPAVTPTLPGTYGGELLSLSSYINPTLIETALNGGGNVTIKTTGPATQLGTAESKIRVAQNITKTSGGAASLTLIAHGDVQVDTGITIGSTTGTLSLEFEAGKSFDSSVASTTGGSVQLLPTSSLVSNGGSIVLKGTTQSATTGVAISGANVNAGAGNLTIAGNSASSIGVDIAHSGASSVLTGGTVSITGGSSVNGPAGIQMFGSSVTGSNGLTVESLNSIVSLSATTLTASGGNLTVRSRGATTGAPPTVNYSLSVASATVGGPAPATPSVISNTGAGTVTIDAQTTSHGSSFGSPSAFLLANSTISSAGGAISITGGGGTSGFVEGATGVQLQSGARVTSSGNISITGTMGNQATTNSRGLAIDNGASVTSTGGNVTLSGTYNNPSSTSGKGAVINGYVSSGSSGSISVTGSATVGGASGTGVDIGPTAALLAGTGGLTVTGSVSSSTTATAIVATTVQGTATSSGAISISGTVSAASAAGATGVSLSGGSISATGSATVTITGSGVPAPAPASSYDVALAGTTVSSAGGLVKFVGDRINLASNVNSGTGRTMFVPFNAGRAITLGGTNEAAALNLSNSELNQVTASTIVVGGSSYTGGIAIGNTGGNISPTNASALSLINQGAITQTAPVTVSSLNADTSSGTGAVTLTNTSNAIGTVSGRASNSAAFSLTSSSALTVGTVDSVSGIIAGNATVNATGALTVAQNVTSNAGATSLQGNGITFTSSPSPAPATTVSGTSVSLNGLTGNMNLGGGAINTSGSATITNAANVVTGEVTATTGLSFSNVTGTVAQQAGSSVDTGTLTGSALAGAITLGNLGNKFSAIGTLATSGGGITIRDNTGNLSITGPVSGGTGIVKIGTSGDLTQAATVGSNAAGDAIILYSGNYINTFGSSAMSLSSGRWLVYSTNPASNTFGGLDSASAAVYNSTLDLNPPNTIPSGNRYVFSFQPTVSVTANSQTRVYDRTATFASPTHTVTGGLVNAATYGNVFTQDALSGSLSVTSPGAAAGTYAIGLGTLTAPAGYASINYTPANATVTQAPLTVTGLSGVNRSFDGTTVASLSGTATLVGVISGDTVTSTGTTSGTFADKNVGTGKAITTSIGLSGGVASNYQLTQPTGLTANVTPAALTVSTANLNRMYDGTTNATGAAPVVTGGTLFAGDTLAGGTFAFTNKNVGTGNKTVNVSGVTVSDGNAGANYTLTQAANTTSTITQAPLSLNAVTDSKTYNGNTNSSGVVSITGLVGGDTVTGLGQSFQNKNVLGANASTLQVNGGYTVNDGNTGGNYNVTTNTAAGTITPAALTVSTANLNRMYDGTTNATGAAPVVTGGTLFAGDTLAGGTFAFTNKNVGTGNKTVNVSGVTVSDGNAGANYTLTQAANTTSTITQAPLSLNAVTDSKTYNGNTNSSGVVSITGLVGGDTVTGLGQSFQNKNVLGANASTLQVNGGYTVNDGNTGGNYNVTTNTAAGTITPAALTVSTANLNRMYDGTTNATGAAPVVTGGTLFAGDTLAGGTFAFTNKNVGTGNKTVNVSGVTVSDGNAGANYTLTQAANTTSTITQAPLSLNAVTDSKTYNGNTNSSGVVSITGLVGGDTVTGLGQSFQNKNVLGANASTLQVNGGYTVNDGNTGGNYNVTTNTAAGTITPAALTVSTANLNRMYDGTTNATGAAPVVTGGTLFAGDTLAGGTFAFTNKNVGTGNKTVNVSGVTVSDGNAGANYTLTQAANTTSTITQAPLSLNAVTDSKTYNGNTNSSGVVSITGLVGGDTVTGLGQSFQNKNVLGANASTLQVNGGYTVNDGNTGGNYNVTTNTAAGTITPAALTVSTANLNRMYDGTTNATGAAPVVTGGTLFAGDTLAGGTFAFTNKNVGTGNKTVNVSGVTVSDGNAGANYTLTQAANTTSTITQAPLSLNAVTDSKTYNGNTNSSGVVSITGLVGGDTVTGLGQSFQNKNVLGANASTLQVNGGYTVNDGNTGGNYNVTTNTAAGTITPAALTVSTANLNRMYDGTTNATGAAPVVTGGTLFAGDTLAGGTFAFTNKNVGTGNVTVNVSGVTVSDGNAGPTTPSPTPPTPPAASPAANLNVTGVSATSRTYDGTTNVAAWAGHCCGHRARHRHSQRQPVWVPARLPTRTWAPPSPSPSVASP
jgi:filamentous hemagglutinin family protein